MRTLAAALTLAVVAAAPAALAAQAVSASDGTVYVSAGLSGFTTLGSQLTNMSVVARFSDGSTSAGSFGDLGGGLYGVNNGVFSLTIGNVDTFDNPFTLANARGANNAIVGLTLSGSPGALVFDRTLGGVEGSPGSALGADFVFSGPGLADTRALYTNVVRIGAAPPVLDIYERIVVDFGSGGLAGGQSLAFVADVDAARSGTIITPTPEPSAVLLMGAGVAGLAAAARRRRRAASTAEGPNL